MKKNNFYKVLALSETHCRADQPGVLEPIQGYKSWHTERSGADKGVKNI